jgi:hypothetical protein
MRVELFFKSPPQALATIGLLLPTPVEISGFNLPNKVSKDCTLETALAIKEAYPAARDLCVHYSLKYNAEKTVEGAADRLRLFLNDAERAGASKVLLVSGGAGGGGKMRKKVNTVTVLQQLQQEGLVLSPGIEVGVAFNPYYPAPYAREEFERLQDKLATRLVSHVWINFGSDTRALEAALVALAALDLRARGVRLIGSLFVPSKALLAKFRFRMWSGLYLSEQYMESVEGATQVTAAIQALYARFGVEPLIESAIRTEKDVAQFVEVATSGADASADAQAAAGASSAEL